MSIENARKFMALGMPAELASAVSGALDSAGASVAWNDVTGKPATFPATVPVATATALATGRTIALTGGATGTSAAFDGSANVSFAVALATPVGATRGGVLLQAAVPSLTGAVGTADNAMTALAATTAAATGADTATLPTKVSVDAIIVACNNNLADLQAKVNAILVAVRAAGMMTP